MLDTTGPESSLKFGVTERRLAGESPSTIWREYRDLTTRGLRTCRKISEMIAAIEGCIGTLKKPAAALKVDMENFT